MSGQKPVKFLGSALDDLRAFPTTARREAGHQIDRVQHGDEPNNWKPMPTIGPGTQEIRIRDISGTFRIILIAKSSDIIYVLHCFKKKTPKTSKPDLDLAKRRYSELLMERGQ